jgi:hypothetical protein
VCIVLGCSVLLVLRAVNDGFLVVGPCFVHSFLKGETLLGPLPENIRVANVPHNGIFGMGFVDGSRDTVCYLDPRLEKLGLQAEIGASCRLHGICKARRAPKVWRKHQILQLDVIWREKSDYSAEKPNRSVGSPSTFDSELNLPVGIKHINFSAIQRDISVHELRS